MRGAIMSSLSVATRTCPEADAAAYTHDFGQEGIRPAERRVTTVATLTVAVMGLEVAAGWWTGSMALLADGVHMGGHAVALGLAAGAYAMSRRYARDRRLSLGSGKINDLAAYTSALILAVSTGVIRHRVSAAPAESRTAAPDGSPGRGRAGVGGEPAVRLAPGRRARS